ncbi:MAG TPA: GAF domain-containing sensor histidine kinase [Aggregatilineales bacterium]|nr:GAF domain-containing sensor histidine kinase [Aggregatilineales bacterium]
MNSPSQPMPIFSNEVAVRNYLQLMARYERLMEISRQLNSILDLGTLLNKIIKAATELTDTQSASIMLIDRTTGELRFEAASDMSLGAMEALVVPLEGSLAGWVVQHGEPVLVEDTRNEPRWFKRVDDTIEFRTRNLLGVPMSAHNKVIGVVEAINKRENSPWTEDDVNTLTTLAAQAAIAIENARLFQQSDFISEMVHELRTPLAALKASTTLLLRPELPEKRRQGIIETMQAETDRLSRLTTDFLDLARLESGRARLETTVFKAADLIRESIEVVHSQATERGVRVFDECDPEQLIQGDRGKVKQVLLNLLTNAIKYNKDHGEIHVSVALTDESHSGKKQKESMARVAVHDTGHGMSKESQAHMFEKFYRAAETSGSSQGTGLGLVIAKRIAEAHGGEMWLESEPGEGTTFFFTLPTVTAPQAPPSTPLVPGDLPVV